MRHKYDTIAFVLSRTPHGEANAYLTLLTPELGLVRARAEGVRKSGAKLASALTTFSESDLVLVRGKETWRVAGALLRENWSIRLPTKTARECTARIAGLLLRLVAGETPDPALFPFMKKFFESLTTASTEAYDALEILAALYVLTALGLEPSPLPPVENAFSPERIEAVKNTRAAHIARINRGITASGL